MMLRWMLSQLSSNIAQSLISPKQDQPGDKDHVQPSVTAPEERQRPERAVPSDPPKHEVSPITEASKATTTSSTESDPILSQANDTSESGRVPAVGAISVSAAPEGVEGALALGSVNTPRDGQVRTRGKGRRGSRRRKVILPVMGGGGGGGEEAAPNVRRVR